LAPRISIEAYAATLIDELEPPQHTGRRFTVGC
jgi:putative NADH-flavin reductase